VFKPLEQFYYNSPEHKGAIKGAEEDVALRYARPNAFEKASGEGAGKWPYTQAEIGLRADYDARNKAQEQRGAASLDPTTIYVRQPDGSMIERQVTRQQYSEMVGGSGGAQSQQGGTQPGLAPTQGGPMYGKPYTSPTQQKLSETGIKRMDDAFDAELAANKRTQALGQMAEAAKGFTPGATRELQLRGAAILRDLGFIKGNEVPSAETFNQMSRYLQVHAQPKGQGSASNYEREIFAQIIPNMKQTPETIAWGIDTLRRLDDYDRAVAKVYRDVAQERGAPDPIEVQQRIAKLGPPLSPGEMSALEGVRAGKGSAAQPAEAPQSGVTSSGVKWRIR
jgi:hypothetical protein